MFTRSSRHSRGIMTSFYSICIVLGTVCVNPLSAVSEFTVSGHVGSTAVLPCKLQTEVTGTPYIKWEIRSEIVFERVGEETYQGKGYEGRVDVPEEELRKGNCALVLRNLTPNDAADYRSAKIVSRTKGSVETETVEISRVHLSVEVPEFTVSGHVGSTAVLPCELQTEVNGTPHIKWSIKSETVFERHGEETYQGEGYEGRVDVPEEELCKGNCSLVLRNLIPTDAALYWSYQIVSRTKRSVETERVEISRVYLSVEEKQNEESEAEKEVPREKQKEEREAEKEVLRAGVWTGVGVGAAGTIAVIAVIGAVLYRYKRRGNRSVVLEMGAAKGCCQHNTSQKHASRGTGCATLTLRVNECELYSVKDQHQTHGEVIFPAFSQWEENMLWKGSDGRGQCQIKKRNPQRSSQYKQGFSSMSMKLMVQKHLELFF